MQGLRETKMQDASCFNPRLPPTLRRCLTVAFLACVAGHLCAELPPDAQEAVKKGMIAAKGQDYLLAIRYFKDARTSAPDAPEIYYYLGLAESKIPGRELRSICWFEAYLTANSTAQNAAVVKDEVDELNIRNQSNLGRLLGLAKHAAELLPDPNWKAADLESVTAALADAGDVEGALATVHEIESLDYNNNASLRDSYKNRALAKVAEAQASAGDVAGAQKTAKLIEREYDGILTGQVLTAIAQAQADAGDFSGALKTADVIPKPQNKGLAQAAIAMAQAKAGDVESARRTCAAALETASQVDHSIIFVYQDSVRGSVAEAQAMAGGVADAQKTADLIHWAKYETNPSKSLAEAAIAEAQARGGDIAGAQKTAELLTDHFDYRQIGLAQAAIALAQAKAGDAAGSEATFVAALDAAGKLPVQHIPGVYLNESSDKTSAQAAIAEAQEEAGEYAAGARKPADPTQRKMVSKWLLRLDYELNTPVFLNLADHLESRGPDDPQDAFVRLMNIVGEAVQAQVDIGRVLKQRSKQ